ncbi:MAG: hypothetical protein MJ016_02215 [Victivallaceae bacterium]|nr:hypothetical protein [Victivallaceae bacterium]
MDDLFTPLSLSARNLHISLRTLRAALSRKYCSAYVAARLAHYYGVSKTCFLPGATKNFYVEIGEKCRLSYKTIQTALAGKPISEVNARKIARALKLPALAFSVSVAKIGRPRKEP